MLNSVGLQNPGVDAVIEEELPRLAKCFHKPVMANVSGFSEEEYVRVCEKFDAVEAVGWIEVNISCPNVHGGGMSFGTSSEAAGAITAAVRRVTKKPLILKLSPNVTDIVSIAKACEAAGADGLSLINTLMGMRIDMKRRRPVLANGTGGYTYIYSGGAAHGLSGVRSGENPDCRDGRCSLGAGCSGNDARRAPRRSRWGPPIW